MLDSCAADSACSEHYPDLEGTLLEAFDRLTVSPEPGTASFDLDGDVVDTLMTGERLAWLVFEALYQTDVIPWLPEIISEAAKGNVEPANLMLSNSLINDAFASVGMYFSTQCADETPFTSQEAIAASIAASPLFSRIQDSEGTYAQDAFDTCAVWDVHPSPPVENEPVRSDIPTLILAGEFDPITPPSSGTAVAANLSNATFVEFPAVGHGLLLEGDCAKSIINAFLDGEDTPDTSCVAEEFSSPAWVAPLGEITLTPVDSPFGVKVAEPQGWEPIENQPGRFLRHEIAGPVLIQTVIPGATVDQFMEQQIGSIPGIEPEGTGHGFRSRPGLACGPDRDRRETAGHSSSPGPRVRYRRHQHIPRRGHRVPVPARGCTERSAPPDAGRVRLPVNLFRRATGTPAG